jgi:hypothetical protein
MGRAFSTWLSVPLGAVAIAAHPYSGSGRIHGSKLYIYILWWLAQDWRECERQKSALTINEKYWQCSYIQNYVALSSWGFESRVSDGQQESLGFSALAVPEQSHEPLMNPCTLHFTAGLLCESEHGEQPHMRTAAPCRGAMGATGFSPVSAMSA